MLKVKSKKRLIAMSLVEMLVALGITGSAIFTMLVIAAKTSKVAVINQQRNIATQTASQGIELTIRAYRENRLSESEIPNLCSGNEIYIGLIEGTQGNLEIKNQGLVSRTVQGENVLVLPMKANVEGRWIECSEGEAELFRGIGLKKVTSAGEGTYIAVRSILYWEVFQKSEFTVISTRLANVCEGK